MQGKPPNPTYQTVNPELYAEEKNLVVQSKTPTNCDDSLITCSDCKKQFADNRSLQRHSVIHKGVRPFSCDDCGKAFMLRGDLTRHLLIHSGKRPYACTVCERRFTLKGNLMQHIRTHTPEKQFTCTLCRKSFSQKESLYRHIRAHFGEKPYNCETCGKTFSLRGDLTRHILIHTGQRPHCCPICGRCFALKGNMTQHIRTHTNYAELMTDGETQTIKRTTILNLPEHLSANGNLTSKEIWQVSETDCTIRRKNIPTSTNEIGVPYVSNAANKPISVLNCSSLCVATIVPLHSDPTDLRGEPNSNGLDGIKTNFSTQTKNTDLRQPDHPLFLSGLTGKKPEWDRPDLMCTLCEKAFKNRRYLKLHVERHKSAQADFMCVHCQKSFLSKSEHFFHSCRNASFANPASVGSDSSQSMNGVLTVNIPTTPISLNTGENVKSESVNSRWTF